MTINECIKRMQDGIMTADQAAIELGEHSYAVPNYSPARGEWDQYQAIVSAHKQIFAKKPQQVAQPEIKMVKCSCGHNVPQGLVMSASMGTSCPNCYDRMSN